MLGCSIHRAIAVISYFSYRIISSHLIWHYIFFILSFLSSLFYHIILYPTSHLNFSVFFYLIFLIISHSYHPILSFTILSQAADMIQKLYPSAIRVNVNAGDHRFREEHINCISLVCSDDQERIEFSIMESEEKCSEI